MQVLKIQDHGQVTIIGDWVYISGEFVKISDFEKLCNEYVYHDIVKNKVIEAHKLNSSLQEDWAKVYKRSKLGKCMVAMNGHMHSEFKAEVLK